MIVVALPVVLDDLRAPLAWGSWIVISYLMAMAAVQPLGGALGDRFGRRGVMLAGLVLFALASVLAALAPSIELLVLARTLQAVAGASAIPNGMALVRVVVSRERLGRAFGAIGVGVGVAAALGPPLGGVIADVLGWRCIFALNLLVLVPGLLLLARSPAAPPARPGARFDAVGAALLVTTLVAAVASATLWRLPAVTAATVTGLALGALLTGLTLVRHLRRSEAPVLDLTLLERPGFLAAGMSVATSNLVMYTVFLALPLFLAATGGWEPRAIGALLAGMSLAMLVCGPIGGALGDRFGRRAPALAGALIAAAGVLPFTVVAPTWPWWTHLTAVTLLGTGLGLSSASVQAAAMQSAGPSAAGQAAGLFSTMRYLGSIAGSAILAALLGASGSLEGYRWLFVIVSLSAAAAVASAARLPGAARLRS